MQSSGNRTVPAFIASILMLAGTPAFADIIYTTSGTTDGGSASVSGKADFNINTLTSTMTLTLTNTTSSVGKIAQVLDGLSFTANGATGLSLTSVSASGFLDCTSGSTCKTVGSFFDYHSNTTLSSPYNWAYSPGLLAAGSGSWKPAGIVNNNTVITDGIPNKQHNDYLVGPVAFTFGFTAAPTDITGVTFYWGTTPDPTTGSRGTPTPPASIPDPATLFLLGAGLLGLTFLRRRLWG